MTGLDYLLTQLSILFGYSVELIIVHRFINNLKPYVMKRLVFFLVIVAISLAASNVSSQIHEGYQIRFTNTVPATLTPVVMIEVNEDVDTLLNSGEGVYENAIVPSITLPGPGTDNGFKPSFDIWTVPEAVDVVYVKFTYYMNGRALTSVYDFDVVEGITEVIITPEIIGYPRTTKPENVSDLLLIKNNQEFELKIKAQEPGFSKEPIVISGNSGTYTKATIKTGVYHLNLYTLQAGVTIHTVKTVFVTNTTSEIEITPEDVKPLNATSGDAKMDVASVKIENQTGYPITVVLPAILNSSVDGKKVEASDPTMVFLGPNSKTKGWYKVNQGTIPLTINLSFKGQELRFDLQTIIFDGQKTLVIAGGVKNGLRIMNTPQKSSAYTY